MSQLSTEDTFNQIQVLQRQLLVIYERCTGISASRMQLLALIYEADEISQTALQKLIGTDHAAIARQLKQMEAEDWVSRRNNPQDNRFTLVKLTHSGREKLTSLSAGREQFLSQVFQGLTQQELQQFSNALTHINSNLEQM